MKRTNSSSLFGSGRDWRLNACLNFSHDDRYLYAEGYKEAAQVLVEHVRSNRMDLDTMVYPIIFLYRHYLELRLMQVITDGGNLLDDTWNELTGHNLETLWREARQVIERVFPKDDRNLLVESEAIVIELSTIDPRSTTFRYPKESDGRRPLSGISHINLARFQVRTKKLMDFLEGVTCALGEYRASKAEMIRDACW